MPVIATSFFARKPFPGWMTRGGNSRTASRSAVPELTTQTSLRRFVPTAKAQLVKVLSAGGVGVGHTCHPRNHAFGGRKSVDRHRVAYGDQDEKSPIPEGLGLEISDGARSAVGADDCASLKATATVISGCLRSKTHAANGHGTESKVGLKEKSQPRRGRPGCLLSRNR